MLAMLNSPLMLKNVRAALVFGTTALAVALMASPAVAATVYTWTTDEGVTSFTDDAKRIPAKYKKAAKTRTVGKLTNYPRYTASQIKQTKPYGERVQARLEALRAAPAVHAGPAHAAGARHPITYDMSTGSRMDDQVSIPVEQFGDGPLVTTSHRVRTPDRHATQHVLVVKQNGRVIAVRVGEGNDRRIFER